jgi:hypothetical protein
MGDVIKTVELNESNIIPEIVNIVESVIAKNRKLFEPLTELYVKKTTDPYDFVWLKAREELKELEVAILSVSTKWYLFKADKISFTEFCSLELDIDSLNRTEVYELVALHNDVLEELVDCIIVNTRLAELRSGDKESDISRMLKYRHLSPFTLSKILMDATALLTEIQLDGGDVNSTLAKQLYKTVLTLEITNITLNKLIKGNEFATKH